MLGAFFLATILDGTVVDGRTMLPVGGARVEVKSKRHPTLVTTTGEDGRFTVDAWESRATISAVKYEPSVDALGSHSGVLRVNAGQRDVIVILKNHHWIGVQPPWWCGAFQPLDMWDRYVIVPDSYARCTIPH